MPVTLWTWVASTSRNPAPPPSSYAVLPTSLWGSATLETWGAGNSIARDFGIKRRERNHHIQAATDVHLSA